MSVSQTSDGKAATTANPTMTALRWYMRIAGLLLILVPLSIPIVGHPSFRNLIGDRAPLMVLGLAAIVGSFGARANWLMGALLACMWVIVSVGVLYGSAGAPLPFEIVNIVVALSGIVIVLLSYRAAQEIHARRS
jgi:hypothetical protein